MSAIPQLTLADLELGFTERHLLREAVSYWTAEKPHAVAIVNAGTEPAT